MTKNRYVALVGCDKCGKSRKEVQRALDAGISKPIGHKELLKRLKKAGLPTKI